MALSDPQKRTARRVGSYDRLWFGKLITSPKLSSRYRHRFEFGSTAHWVARAAFIVLSKYSSRSC